MIDAYNKKKEDKKNLIISIVLIVASLVILIYLGTQLYEVHTLSKNLDADIIEIPEQEDLIEEVEEAEDAESGITIETPAPHTEEQATEPPKIVF